VPLRRSDPHLARFLTKLAFEQSVDQSPSRHLKS
jgi:hypothetical protein